MDRSNIVIILLVTGVYWRMRSKQPAGVQPTVQRSAATKAPETVTLNGAGCNIPVSLISKWSSEYKDKTECPGQLPERGKRRWYKANNRKNSRFCGKAMRLSQSRIYKYFWNRKYPIHRDGGCAYNLPAYERSEIERRCCSGYLPWENRKMERPRIISLILASVPANDIIVAHRSDGSGTTFFTDYLSR